MKKTNGCGFRHLAALALACTALTASADLIYWMVDDAVGDKNSGKQGESIDFSYASISADGGATYLNIYDTSGPTEYWRLYADNNSTGAAYAGAFNSDTTSSFLIQLWDDDDTLVGWKSYQLSSIMDSIWKENVPSATGATTLSVHEVVPEPTSGLLLLIGGALLALRRGKARSAEVV